MDRVLIVTNSFPPLVGGAEKQAALLAQGLLRRGWRPEVLTRRLARRVAGFEDPCVVHRLSAHRLGYFLAAAAEAVQGPRPVAVMAWSLDAPLLVGLATKLLRRVPLLVRVPGGDPEVRSRSSTSRFRLAAAFADAWIAVTHRTTVALQEAGVDPSSIHLVRNPVDPSPSRERTPRVGGPVVLYVGRLEPIKGVDVLLESWPGVHRRHPEAVLELAGEGSLGPRPMPGVRWLGTRRDVDDLLRRADLVVVPSRHEGCCNVLLEAMAAGVPALATSVGGNPELLGNLGRECLVPAGSPPALVAGIDRLLGNDALRASLGEKGRRRVSQRHDPGKALDIYTDLLEACRRRSRAVGEAFHVRT